MERENLRKVLDEYVSREEVYGLPSVLTVEEAANFLRLNVKTVYTAISAGQMPGRKIGNRTVILRDGLLDWLQSSERVLPSRKRSR